MPDDEHSIENGATNSKTCQNRYLDMNKFTSDIYIGYQIKEWCIKKIINTIVKH